jgi:hypothetical protein
VLAERSLRASLRTDQWSADDRFRFRFGDDATRIADLGVRGSRRGGAGDREGDQRKSHARAGA